MTNKLGYKTQIGAMLLGSAGMASAAAGDASEVATTLSGIISTYGGALTGVVVAGVVMRFIWKWIKSVR